MIVAGKYNTYEVIDQCENGDGSQKWFRLKCVDFYAKDDLGDQIFCTTVGQMIWVANYHFRHMPVLDVVQ